MRILITNDDGIAAPGIASLYEAVSGMGELHVVAPAEVQSAQSHAVTFGKTMAARTHRVRRRDGAGHLFEGISVEGRPADCVKLAIDKLVPKPVDLVLSGINAGANIGINVIYSGTVAAAMEAGFMGIPAIAISLHLGDIDNIPWHEAARHARTTLQRVLAKPLRPHTVLNINLPILDGGRRPRGTRVVPISTSPIVDCYTHEPHPAGGAGYRAASHLRFHHTPPESDVAAIFDRYITITPMHFDLTKHRQLPAWRRRLARR